MQRPTKEAGSPICETQIVEDGRVEAELARDIA
jgi:hypothetical protein